MSLVMAQIQVEAEKICCRNTRARNIFDSCRAQVGCTSSLCGPLTTVQNSGASEIGDGAVEQCANACSILCTTGSTKLAVETA
ncbi:thionin-2.1 isoform X3 [Brassica napus]|uniref:thionin-2.1 isoform X3 n=1 Tax=Brassica napus TaxID=3708 RepID=UPI0006AB6B65|nr:thionin-2.1 isoform X3 [Brassica napus]